MSVDRTASAFLRNYLKTKEAVVFEAEPLVTEEPEIVRLTDSFNGNVILMRVDSLNAPVRKYYGGIIGRGDKQRPVWVPDAVKAKPVCESRAHMYEEKLGVELFPMHPMG
jgi:hypothetical protein